MPKQGNASLALAECEGGLRLCINILKLIVKGQVPSLQQHVICKLRFVQRRVQSHSHSECSVRRKMRRLFAVFGVF